MSESYRVEIFQARDSRQFLDDDGEITNEEMYDALRDARTGFFDAEDIGHERFTRLYNLVGGDTIEAESEEAALNAAFEQWNNGSGKESEAFRESNNQERAFSLSTGNIVRVNGTAYYCEPVGWSELPEVSY